MIRIALIEIGAFHDECLYSQIQYLKDKNHEITLICNSKLEPRVNKFPGLKKIIYLDLSTKISKYKSWYTTWRYITKNKFSKIIFNSVENNIKKLILFPYSKNIEFIGTLHDSSKLKKIFNKRINKFFVLNDLVVEQVRKEKLTKNKVCSYYPIFFLEYKSTLVKPKNEIWITIPGVIDFNKRDYRIFKDLEIPNNIKIIFLGRTDNPKAEVFYSEAKTYSSYSKFKFFNNFIPNQLFHDYIKKSDYILPLIHPTTPEFEKFLNQKISGSYNLAFAYKIPLLIEKSLSGINDFEDTAIFYDHKKLFNLFEKLKANKKGFYQNPKWSFEYQKQNYLKFIFDK